VRACRFEKELEGRGKIWGRKCVDCSLRSRRPRLSARLARSRSDVGACSRASCGGVGGLAGRPVGRLAGPLRAPRRRLEPPACRRSAGHPDRPPALRAPVGPGAELAPDGLASAGRLAQSARAPARPSDARLLPVAWRPGPRRLICGMRLLRWLRRRGRPAPRRVCGRTFGPPLRVGVPACAWRRSADSARPRRFASGPLPRRLLVTPRGGGRRPSLRSGGRTPPLGLLRTRAAGACAAPRADTARPEENRRQPGRKARKHAKISGPNSGD